MAEQTVERAQARFSGRRREYEHSSYYTFPKRLVGIACGQMYGSVPGEAIRRPSTTFLTLDRGETLVPLSQHEGLSERLSDQHKYRQN